MGILADVLARGNVLCDSENRGRHFSQAETRFCLMLKVRDRTIGLAVAAPLLFD